MQYCTLLVPKSHDKNILLPPILYTSLVYIDNIVLFSDTLEEHVNLLHQFEALVK